MFGLAVGPGVPRLAERVGLLFQVERNPFTLGDSSAPSKTEKLQEFIGKLQEVSVLLVFRGLQCGFCHCHCGCEVWLTEPLGKCCCTFSSSSTPASLVLLGYCCFLNEKNVRTARSVLQMSWYQKYSMIRKSLNAWTCSFSADHRGKGKGSLHHG